MTSATVPASLADLLGGQLFAVLLVFARLGAAVMLVPGFGEPHVLPRLRLLVGLLLSLLLAPALGPAGLPRMPAEPLALALLVGREVVVGLLLGVAARLALAVLHLGGALFALQSGLSAAAMLDPNEATQGTVPGSFLTAAALALLFAADLHHLLLRAMAASYAALPPTAGLDLGAAAELLTRLGSDAIATGLKLAGPMILAGTVVNLGLGALGRLVPAFPAFFLALPLQILLALLVLELSLPAALALFAGAFEHGLAWLDRGG